MRTKFFAKLNSNLIRNFGFCTALAQILVRKIQEAQNVGPNILGAQNIGRTKYGDAKMFLAAGGAKRIDLNDDAPSNRFDTSCWSSVKYPKYYSNATLGTNVTAL